mmetsp:Transcript_27083/g.108427  ORF Transcript_27083/g.108427 Transcript_27083/m.108427 type:complete len:467 (+) Transcript_27083:864-2264(+)
MRRVPRGLQGVFGRRGVRDVRFRNVRVVERRVVVHAVPDVVAGVAVGGGVWAIGLRAVRRQPRRGAESGVHHGLGARRARAVRRGARRAARVPRGRGAREARPRGGLRAERRPSRVPRVPRGRAGVLFLVRRGRTLRALALADQADGREVALQGPPHAEHRAEGLRPRRAVRALPVGLRVRAARARRVLGGLPARRPPRGRPSSAPRARPAEIAPPVRRAAHQVPARTRAPRPRPRHPPERRDRRFRWFVAGDQPRRRYQRRRERADDPAPVGVRVHAVRPGPRQRDQRAVRAPVLLHRLRARLPRRARAHLPRVPPAVRVAQHPRARPDGRRACDDVVDRVVAAHGRDDDDPTIRGSAPPPPRRRDQHYVDSSRDVVVVAPRANATTTTEGAGAVRLAHARGARRGRAARVRCAARVDRRARRGDRGDEARAARRAAPRTRVDVRWLRSCRAPRRRRAVRPRDSM